MRPELSTPEALTRSLAHQLRDERSDLLTSAKVHLRRAAPFLRSEEHDELALRAISHVTRAGALEEWLSDPSVKEVMVNADGSVDVYFGPVAPKGLESNWVQTIPGRGWFMILRLYGPLEPWFDKSWRPGEITLQK